MTDPLAAERDPRVRQEAEMYLPWRVHQSMAHETLVAVFNKIGGIVGDGFTDEQATFTCRAVNSHHALLVALRQLVDDYTFICGDGVTEDTESAALKQARAALQLAEEGR